MDIENPWKCKHLIVFPRNIEKKPRICNLTAFPMRKKSLSCTKFSSDLKSFDLIHRRPSILKPITIKVTNPNNSIAKDIKFKPQTIQILEPLQKAKSSPKSFSYFRDQVKLEISVMKLLERLKSTDNF